MSQGPSTTAFAKSTRPELGGVVPRDALFARLDGTGARVLAWISAPPGYGKTTLAASYVEARQLRWAWYQVDRDDDDGAGFLHYLAHAARRLRPDGTVLPQFGPEHRADLVAFARRYFRALFDGVSAPGALVLDNLHELAIDSPLLAVLDAALTQVPRHCCVIVTSRTPPPLNLTRLLPGGQMVCLDGDDLKFGTPELAAMAQLRGCVLAPDMLTALQQGADGWAAALVLMIEHHKLSHTRAQPAAPGTPTVVFNYLAGEIFDRFDAATQRLLLHIAGLPRVTIELARALSGDAAAGRILFNLAHNDYFVRELVGPQGRVFLLHPLLREFLLRRAARDLPQALDPPALRHAAQLLHEAGLVEDAVALLARLRDWPGTIDLINAHSAEMLAQGRHALLAAWLDLLPPDVAAPHAGLLLTRGQALQQASPRLARRAFEAAFAEHTRQADAPGRRRSCAGVIETVIAEFDDLAALDPWLDEYDRCSGAPSQAIDSPSGAQASSAASAAEPPGISMARLWRGPLPAVPVPPAGGLHQVADTTDAAGCARSLAALLRGDVAGAAAFLAGTVAQSAAGQVMRAGSQALQQLVDGDAAAALQSARAGLACAAEQAVHGSDVGLRMIGVAALLGLGDTAGASAELEHLQTHPLRRGDRAWLHHLRSGLARLLGDVAAALRDARSAALLAAEAGLPWLEALALLAQAQLQIDAGDPAGADARLRGAEALVQHLASPLLKVTLLFTQAAAAMELDPGLARARLHDALALARELGLRHVVGLPAELLGRLCAQALQHGVVVDHARLLVSAGGLAPPARARHLTQWPWVFQLRTFGGLDLRRRGEPIGFSAKGPGRPVELLKVLVALGGQNVRVDQLAEALWPRVDADYAHKSFTATLHRLRRILDHDDSIRLADARLSLNSQLFWLDTWALDELLADLDTRLRDADDAAADEALLSLVNEALALYRGAFLSDDHEHASYVMRREQVRARLLRSLPRLARRWIVGGRSDAVVDCYQRCIDADELCEAFHRHLMLSHIQRGETLEALAVHDRLRAVLLARLDRAPSAETQAVIAGLRA